MSREEQWGTLAHPGYGLRDACRIGDLERVRSQISSGVSVRSIDEAFERTPLHHAAHTGHAAICELLINSGAQVDAVDIGNQTPMHLAAERGHSSVISVLVKKHANLAARTPVGNVPLHYAAQGNHSGAAAMIVALMREQNLLGPSREAYKAFRNNWGESPPEAARSRGHSGVAEQLGAIESTPRPWEMTTPSRDVSFLSREPVQVRQARRR